MDDDDEWGHFLDAEFDEAVEPRLGDFKETMFTLKDRLMGVDIVNISTMRPTISSTMSMSSTTSFRSTLPSWESLSAEFKGCYIAPPQPSHASRICMLQCIASMRRLRENDFVATDCCVAWPHHGTSAVFFGDEKDFQHQYEIIGVLKEVELKVDGVPLKVFWKSGTKWCEDVKGEDVKESKGHLMLPIFIQFL